MTTEELRNINKKISNLKSKILRLEGEATNTAVKLYDAPGCGGFSDKISNAVTQIADLQKEIQDLETLRNSALNRLSRDVFEENCLYMHYCLKYSWPKIAIKVGSTVDSIKKRCYRYRW